MTAATAVTCFHCGRGIVFEGGYWIDPEAPTDTDADGNPVDDGIWRETCDAHDTFTAQHEPKQAGLGVGHVWTNMACPAYRTTNPADCVCGR